MRRILAVLLLVFSVGCATAKPAGAFFSVPATAGEECVSHCAAQNMRFGALVIIMNATGCVCEPKGATSPCAGTSAGVAAGAVIEAQRQQQQQQNASSHR